MLFYHIYNKLYLQYYNSFICCEVVIYTMYFYVKYDFHIVVLMVKYLSYFHVICFSLDTVFSWFDYGPLSFRI